MSGFSGGEIIWEIVEITGLGSKNNNNNKKMFKKLNILKLFTKIKTENA